MLRLGQLVNERNNRQFRLLNRIGMGRAVLVVALIVPLASVLDHVALMLPILLNVGTIANAHGENGVFCI